MIRTTENLRPGERVRLPDGNIAEMLYSGAMRLLDPAGHLIQSPEGPDTYLVLDR